MQSLFLAAAAIGTLVLVVQIVLGLFGLDGSDHGDLGLHTGDATLGEGLELLSVRSVAAGVGFFGLAGLGSLGIGLPSPIGAVVGAAVGAAALVGTAMLMRQIVRLDSDGSLRVEAAVGLPATVYLTIPANRTGPGKVHLALQGRTLELAAVTTADDAIPNGAPVVVVSIVDPDTVEVIPTSTVEQVIHGDS